MVFYVSTDNTNKITSISRYNADGYEQIIESEEDFEKLVLSFSSGKDLYLEDNKIVDKTKSILNINIDIIRHKKERIMFLKNLLNETDYKIIKNFELFIKGEELELDFNKIQSDRKTWRFEINQLEEEISVLGG